MKKLVLVLLATLSVNCFADHKKPCPRICIPWYPDPCCVHPPVSK